MEEVLNFYKPAGLTPLEAITLFKKKHSEYANERMTYAGRLDPLAEGVLVVLSGTGIYRKKDFLNLDKTYEAELLSGFGTDTFDILGKPFLRKEKSLTKESVKKLEGDFFFETPVYSSYKIKGRPLFWWARQGRLDEIKIPERNIMVKSARFLGARRIRKEEILNNIAKKIDGVGGDFRQEEIKKDWRDIFSKTKKESFHIYTIRFSVTSGTYIRAIANSLGCALYGLKRTAVGDFKITDSTKLYYR